MVTSEPLGVVWLSLGEKLYSTWQASHPGRSSSIPSRFLLRKPELWASLMNHLTRKQTSPFYVSFFQFLKDGYAAHLTSLSNQAMSRPAVGNSRLILRRGCFGLPSRLSKTRHKIKRSISDKPLVDSDVECSTISGSFNYSSFRHTKGRSVSKFDQEY